MGVSWLASTDGVCKYCRAGQENLCEAALFTGYTVDGGYATYTVADERYCFPIPDAYTDVEAAPLMCAGLIGYRSLVKAGDAERLGIYGFGAAAHIIAQVAVFQGREVYAFTRPGDTDGQQFARELGADLGRRFDEPAAGGAGRRDHLRAGRCSRPRGSAGRAQGRNGCLRRHPHERYPLVPVRASLGRAHAVLRR